MAIDTSGTLNTTPSATFDVSIPSHSSGDLLVVVAYKRETSGAAPSISTSGWTVDQVQPSSTAGRHALIGSKIGNGSETTVRLTNMNGSVSAAKVYVIDDPAGTPLVGIGNSSGNNTTTGAFGVSSGSPAVGDYAFSAIGTAGNVTGLAADNGYTATGTGGAGSLAHKVLDTTTEDLTWTWTTSRGFDAIIAVYAKAAGVTGTAAITLADATASAAGTPVITGTASISLEGASTSVAGSPIITASAAITLESATVSATGSVGDEVTGTAAITLADATASASGSPIITATGSVSLDPATATASGSPIITASGAVSLSPATASASGTPHITGSASISLAGASISVAGTPVITASAAITLSPATAAASGTPHIVGTASITLAGATVLATNAPIGRAGKATTGLRRPLVVISVREGATLTIERPGA